MKYIFLTTALIVATPLWAERFELPTKVESALISPSGGFVTRGGEILLPAGRHQISILGLPDDFQIETLQVGFEDSAVEIISVEIDFNRSSVLEAETPEFLKQLEVVKSVREKLHEIEAETSIHEAAIKGADLREQFVRGIAGGDSSILELNNLTDLNLVRSFGDQIGEQITIAQIARDKAERELARLAYDWKKVARVLELAEEKLSTLTPETNNPLGLILDVQAAKEVSPMLELSYLDLLVKWQPFAEIQMKQNKSNAEIALKQLAFVSQETHEDWKDVNVTLTTADPRRRMEEQRVRSDIRHLVDPATLYAKRKSVLSSSSDSGVMMEEEVIVELMEKSTGTLQVGQIMTYELPYGLSVDAGETGHMVDLAKTIFEGELWAQANVTENGAATLYTEFTNESGTSFLPSDAAVYRDGQYFGSINLPQLVAGDSFDLPLGPLDGVQIEHRKLARQDGDTGVFRSANLDKHRFEATARSFLDYEMPLRVLGSLPVSESEDLEIKTYVEPAIAEDNIDGKRGVFAWEFDLGKGAVQKLSYGYDLKWPEGQEVRRGPKPQ